MHRETAHTTRRGRAPVVLLLALAIVAVFGIAAQQALAYGSYEHSTATSCSSCHKVSTDVPPTNANCITCHTGYATIASGKTCWTCHTPGQDMAAVKAGVPTTCTATCHLASGAVNTHNPHPTRGACTTAGCHTVTTSATIANGSPHHTVPAPAAPTVAGFTPASGPVGTSVTVTGTGFATGATVAFHGTAATIVTFVSATQIKATVPAGATTGTIAVTVAGVTGTSVTSFTVTPPPAPFVTTVSLKVAPKTIKLKKTVKATGAVTPIASLAGKSVKITIQKKSGAKWKTVKSKSAMISATGLYAYKYKPLKKGSYRMKASIAATATYKASKSAFRTFKVK